MAGMSRNNSTSSIQGFSVFQNSLGAPLQFLPALGSKQLDDMIDAYVAGSASIQEKRAQVSMDFFEYAQHTGETFKYYPVFSASFGSATDSPASSAMQDSGYGSAFNVSPVMSDLTWNQSTAFTSPAQSFNNSFAPSQQQKQTASRKASSSNAKAQSTDFSHLPGMKIMTKDGTDVTNSASRGCKTKEQRDHAHLMRILKACDACKKKKIRCDPSHRKATRTASQASVQSEGKPAKKVKKSASQSPPAVSPEVALVGASFQMAPAPAAPVEDFSGFAQEPWDQFLQYDEEPTMAIPDDYDFFFDPAGYFSPSSGSSTSPVQPFTPAVTAPSAGLYNDNYALPVTDSQEPILPYLNPSGHGSNYVDFNLYSPASSFIDEEPQALQKKSDGALVDAHANSQGVLKTQSRSQNIGATSSTHSSSTLASQERFTGEFYDQNWSFDLKSQSSTTDPTEPGQGVPGAQYLATGGRSSTGLSRHLQTSKSSHISSTSSIANTQPTTLANTASGDFARSIDFTYVSDSASSRSSPTSTTSSSMTSPGVSPTDSTSITSTAQTSLVSSPSESLHSGYNPRRKPDTRHRLKTSSAEPHFVDSQDAVEVLPGSSTSAVLNERLAEFNRKQVAIERAVSAQGLSTGSGVTTDAGRAVIHAFAENRRTRRNGEAVFHGERSMLASLPSQLTQASAGPAPATATSNLVSGCRPSQGSSTRHLTESADISSGGLSFTTYSPQQAMLSSAVTKVTAVSAQPHGVIVDQSSTSRLAEGLASCGGAEYPTNALVNLLVAALLLFTRPVRQIAAGFSHSLGKSLGLSSQLSQSVVFGLASLALAFTLQSSTLANLSGQHSLPMIILSLAPFALRHENHHYTPSTDASSEALSRELPSSASSPSAMFSPEIMA